MTSRAKVLALVFIGLELLAALGMVALSVHGPAGLGVAAPLYVLVAAGLTWWVAWRSHGAAAVAATGLLMLAAAPGVFALLDRLERVAHERRVAATRVSDVRDDVILSSSGRPIGVRLSYTVSVPEPGYFGVLPSLHSRDPRTERLQLNALLWTIDGRSEPTSFQPGKSHLVVVELYPPLVAIMRGEHCLTPIPVPPLPETVNASPLRVILFETTYGNVAHGGRAEVTRGDYDLAELYRGVLAEGLVPCRASPSER